MSMFCPKISFPPIFSIFSKFDRKSLSGAPASAHTQQDPLSIKRDPADMLPDELMLGIFSYLKPSDLAASSLVCKNWRRMAADPVPWKASIHKHLAFGVDKWAECFGSEMLANEQRAPAYQSLPVKEFIEDSRKVRELFPDSNIRLSLVWIPATLGVTPNEKGEFVDGLTFQTINNQLTRYFSPTYDQQLQGFVHLVPHIEPTPLTKSGWLIMTTDVLPESKNTPSIMLKLRVLNLESQGLSKYRPPSIIEAVASIAAEHILSKQTIRPFGTDPETFTFCNELVQLDMNFYPTAVGCFAGPGNQTHEGLLVTFCQQDVEDEEAAANGDNDHASINVGIAASRWFEVPRFAPGTTSRVEL